jgi:hypothetical protein
MRRNLLRWLIVGTLIGAPASFCPSVLAQDEPPGVSKETCRESFEDSQARRMKSELLASRQLLRVCSSMSCPAFIRGQCIEWLGEVERGIPSVIFDAKLDGQDVTDVTVSLDGTTIATSLEGKPIDVDPGIHDVEVSRAGQTPIRRKEVIREGEKSRVISVNWETPKPPSPSEPPSVVPTHRPAPAAVYVLGGLGVVSIGAFAYFGLSANTMKDDLSSCDPFCSNARVDPVRTQVILANVSLGLGVASLAAAVVLFIVRPEKPLATALSRWSGAF